MKLGIFGGTFNPIHNGHISIALRVYEYLNLDKVLFMPNKIPPHKEIKNVLHEQNRIDMINIAINDYDFLGIENHEINKNGVSYTYESLEYLDRIYKGDELFFIVGSDSFINFDKWQKINRIFRSSNLVIYLRDDLHRDIVVDIKGQYEKLYNGKIFLIFDNLICVSSTDVRKKILNKEDFRNLVPFRVYEYIVSNNLYVR